MSMSMMPLVFHVGATSTWMILTSIMAVKSVAIGLLLLVFKIAVSSAKVSVTSSPLLLTAPVVVALLSELLRFPFPSRTNTYVMRIEIYSNPCCLKG